MRYLSARRPQEQQTHFVAKVVGRMRVATDADALIGAITLQSQTHAKPRASILLFATQIALDQFAAHPRRSSFIE